MTGAQQQAAGLVAGAQQHASRVVTHAETWATNIRDDAAHYSAVAAAMKNVVEGYGERFVVPPSSVLDDLAEGYGHAEAGVALKAERAASKHLVKAGLAAACDYVEADRRATACAFVLEAFDGKAEALFSKVKAENDGTLAQKLRDAAVTSSRAPSHDGSDVDESWKPFGVTYIGAVCHGARSIGPTREGRSAIPQSGHQTAWRISSTYSCVWLCRRS